MNQKYKFETKKHHIKEPKIIDKVADIKEYKKLYYQQNIEIYRERNRLYREKIKEMKKLKTIIE